MGLLAVALTLAVATGCGDDDDTARPDDGTTTTTEEPDTTLSPEAEVEAAYLAFWDMFVRLAQNPDPADPEIAQRASGETLGKLIDGLAVLQSLNRRSEFGPQYGHEVVSVAVNSNGTAVVVDCATDDSRIVQADTGETVDEDVVTELSEITLVRGDAGWTVDRSTRLDAWEGAVECA